ncbi:Replication-associated recombination protein A [compost metagenome]
MSAIDDQMSLFAAGKGGTGIDPDSPLAHRMRPRGIDEYLGQEHLLGEDKPLRKLIEADKVPSLIFWGPPGVGKTTLAQLIARATEARFVPFSAVTGGVAELRERLKEAKEQKRLGRRTILFIDEIHRFNKGQQDAFLPHVEDGTVTLIGATTENPSFELNAALLSRARVLTLQPLPDEAITGLLRRAWTDAERGLGQDAEALGDEVFALLTEFAGGDARSALNALETVRDLADRSIESIAQALQQRTMPYDKGGENHYDTISAFIKTIRGSNPDAALYWLARMLSGGEDPVFIARRLLILASEDVGNADPRALSLAMTTFQAVQVLGMPEARIPLAQAVTYLAAAPKSNASYMGINEALSAVAKLPTYPIPLHLRNAPTKLMKQLGYGKEYLYPHDYPGGFVGQAYWPDGMRPQRFYRPTEHGEEGRIKARIEALRASLKPKPPERS